MNTKTILTAIITANFTIALLSANAKISEPAKVSTAGANAWTPVTTDPGTVKNMKDILVKMVRQDEILDENIEKFQSENGKLSPHELTAMGLALKTVKGNLDYIAEMNKKQFADLLPEANLSEYTKTIFSYSKRISEKTAKMDSLIAYAVKVNKRSALRDAVSSRKGKKAVKGKNLTQLMDEQKAMEKLSSDINNLKTSSKRLHASSKWLYLASQ